MIHGSRLVQVQGMADEAVVYHRESDITQKMRRDGTARRVKDADIRFQFVF